MNQISHCYFLTGIIKTEKVSSDFLLNLCVSVLMQHQDYNLGQLVVCGSPKTCPRDALHGPYLDQHPFSKHPLITWKCQIFLVISVWLSLTSECKVQHSAPSFHIYCCLFFSLTCQSRTGFDLVLGVLAWFLSPTSGNKEKCVFSCSALCAYRSCILNQCLVYISPE